MSLFFCPLSHEGVIQVSGPDAKKFLQGQLTCNLDYLSPNLSSLGARCTAKGRMLSSFRIIEYAQSYLLALAADLVEAQLADLKKYAVFSKVQLADVSQQWQRIGLTASDAQLETLGLGLALPNPESGSVALGNDCLLVRLPEQRFELWLDAQSTERLTSLHAQASQASLGSWQLADIRAGIGQVCAATRELFIPQMINLQAIGGVSFRKGCYTGQEIVARMQYLGKLKRRMYRFSSPTPAPEAACELFSPLHNSSVGEVVCAANTAEGCELLAVVQEDAVEDGRLSLAKHSEGSLLRLTLPYTLDRDREIQR